MVKSLGRLLSFVGGWLQESLEIVGLVLACLFVGFRFGGVYVFAVLAGGFLLKSLEVDLLSRKDGP